MLARSVTIRGFVTVMDAAPASAAARFDTFARVLRPLHAEGRKAEHGGPSRWGERGKMFKVEGIVRALPRIARSGT
jgi:hypothetical protein